MKSGKKQITEGIVIQNQERNVSLWEKETYKYMGKLETDIIKEILITLAVWAAGRREMANATGEHPGYSTFIIKILEESCSLRSVAVTQTLF